MEGSINIPAFEKRSVFCNFQSGECLREMETFASVSYALKQL
jgi:hypothetical protein